MRRFSASIVTPLAGQPFLGADGRAEVINIAMIPAMLKLLPWNYCIQGGYSMELLRSVYAK